MSDGCLFLGEGNGNGESRVTGANPPSRTVSRARGSRGGDAEKEVRAPGCYEVITSYCTRCYLISSTSLLYQFLLEQNTKYYPDSYGPHGV